MIFIISVFLICIFAVFLISKYWNYKTIILKNFFRPKNYSDKVEILFICVFSLIFAGLLFITFVTSFYVPQSCCSSSATFRTGYKKSVSSLSFALKILKELEGKDASNCSGCNSNKQALANFFIKRLNVVDSTNPYYKKAHNELSKDSLLNNPHFITNDGMIFIIEKARGRCGDVITNNPDKANCVIIIDTNAAKPPNKFSIGNKKDKNYKINDRFRVVVLKDKIVPAANEENDVAEYVWNN